MDATPPLIEEIDAFVARHDMSPVTFGRLAMKDPHFVRDLRGDGREKPRRLWPETEDRVRAFMAEYRPASTEATAEAQAA